MKKLISVLLSLAMIAGLSMVPVSAADDPGIDPQTVFGEDERYVVNAQKSPYISIGKMLITYEGIPEKGAGTGFLISPTKFVTAGHCLMKETKNGCHYATKIEIYFGMNSRYNYKYSTVVECDSTNTFMPSEWEDEQKEEYDYGMLVLPEAMNTGYSFTLSTISSPSQKSVSIVGYQGEGYNDADDPNRNDFSAYELLRGDGVISGSSTLSLKTQTDALGGQSGSPVLDANNKVVGIFTYGAPGRDENGELLEHLPDGGSARNRMTRITSSLIRFFNSH